MVHLDANCHPGRARPDNVVARNQVTDVRFGSKADLYGAPDLFRLVPLTDVAALAFCSRLRAR